MKAKLVTRPKPALEVVAETMADVEANIKNGIAYATTRKSGSLSIYSFNRSSGQIVALYQDSGTADPKETGKIKAKGTHKNKVKTINVEESLQEAYDQERLIKLDNLTEHFVFPTT
jgi:hypothetical protein